MSSFPPSYLYYFQITSVIDLKDPTETILVRSSSTALVIGETFHKSYIVYKASLVNFLPLKNSLIAASRKRLLYSRSSPIAVELHPRFFVVVKVQKTSYARSIRLRQTILIFYNVHVYGVDNLKTKICKLNFIKNYIS